MTTEASNKAFIRQQFAANPKLTLPLFKPRIFKGHKSGVKAVVVLADGGIISASRDHTLRRWDVDTGECLKVFKGHKDSVSTVVVLADGSIVSASHDKTLIRWDVETGDCLQVFTGHYDGVNAVVVLADGSIVSASFDNTLRRWNVDTGKCLQVFDDLPKSYNHGRDSPGLHDDYVCTMAVLADDSLVLASSSTYTKLSRLDLNTGEYLQFFEEYHEVDAMAVLADNSIVSASNSFSLFGNQINILKHWDINTGECLQVFRGHSNSIYAVAVLTDGSLVSASHDNTLRLWDVKTGECHQVFRGHSDWIYAVAVLADGSIVSGSDDKTLRLHLPNNMKSLPQRLFKLPQYLFKEVWLEIQLEFAIEKNELAQAKTLLQPRFWSRQTSVDINYFNAEGYSPLMLAVRQAEPKEDMVKLLLKHCPDFSLACQDKDSTHFGKTALGITGMQGHYRLIPLLREKMGLPSLESELAKKVNENTKQLTELLAYPRADFAAKALAQVEDTTQDLAQRLQQAIEARKAVQQQLNDELEDEKHNDSARIDDLQQQVNQLGEEHAILWLQHKRAERQKIIITQLKGDPQLCCYYQTLHLKLEALFLSCKAASSGLLEVKGGAISLGGTAIAKGASLFGEVLSFVPGAGIVSAVGKIAGSGMQELDIVRRENQASRGASLESFNELMRLAEATARQLTENFTPQLKKLRTPIEEKEEALEAQDRSWLSWAKQGVQAGIRAVPDARAQSDVEKLANYAALCIYDKLQAGKAPTPLNEVTLAMLPCQARDHMAMLSDKLKELIRLTQIKTTEGQSWVLSDVYLKSGIKIETGECFTHANSDIACYDFRFGTEAEAKQLGMERQEEQEQKLMESPVGEAIVLSRRESPLSPPDVQNDLILLANPAVPALDERSSIVSIDDARSKESVEAEQKLVESPVVALAVLKKEVKEERAKRVAIEEKMKVQKTQTAQLQERTKTQQAQITQLQRQMAQLLKMQQPANKDTAVPIDDQPAEVRRNSYRRSSSSTMFSHPSTQQFNEQPRTTAPFDSRDKAPTPTFS